MAHCGSSEKGLVQNGELIFKSKSNDEHGDYHKDMDSIEFNRWIKTQIIPSFTKKVLPCSHPGALGRQVSSRGHRRP